VYEFIDASPDRSRMQDVLAESVILATRVVNRVDAIA
jgi:hypothetical protein